MSTRFILILAYLAISGMASGQARAVNNKQLLMDATNAFNACEGKKGVNIIDSGHIVCLHSGIGPSMFVKLIRKRWEIKEHPFVVIASPGGRVDSSIDIVRLLDGFRPIPVVGESCFSACAQFLFLMGSQRVLLHCGVVAMHGGPGSISASLAMHLDGDNAYQNSIEDIWRFRDFYKRRNISLDMVDEPPANIQAEINAGKIVFWQWSIHEMEAFGVRGIVSDIDPNLRSPKDYDQVCKKYSVYRP
jgi:hypothetical protein